MKIGVKLDTRHQRKDGTYPLKITIARKGTFYLPLEIYVKEKNWKPIAIGGQKLGEVVGLPTSSTYNIYIRNKVGEVEKQLFALRMAGTLNNYTNEDLLKLLTEGEKTEKPLLFKECYEDYVRDIKKDKTKECYEGTKSKMSKFCEWNTLTFRDINKGWLRSFEKSMIDEGNAINTRSIHLRNIRTLFNYALDNGLIDMRSPFRSFVIESQHSTRHSISVGDFRALLSVEVKGWQQKYIDAYYLSFLLRGINMVDLSQVTEINNYGRINFFRSKSGTFYSIKVEPEALAIFSKYKGKKFMLNWFDNRAKYSSFLERTNKVLKKICKENKLPHITYGMARHCWATYAKDLEYSKDIIAQALGHKHTVTDGYIDYDEKKVDEANRAVIDYLLKLK